MAPDAAAGVIVVGAGAAGLTAARKLQPRRVPAQAPWYRLPGTGAPASRVAPAPPGHSA
jgi:hypothetical protein